ncbi:hypothetical protein Aph01nite_31490 [Acrocarpospora phusangensis]|uniref:Uncharacterized protein n=1 Tax=Acrocarpospora phusangensis TaxID=1070424 RepID=A0A919Q972_9ACTN|nr:hypothetical protein Aph01nite_31490 [Acrocarpospora phusangensis]
MASKPEPQSAETAYVAVAGVAAEAVPIPSGTNSAAAAIKDPNVIRRKGCSWSDRANQTNRKVSYELTGSVRFIVDQGQ